MIMGCFKVLGERDLHRSGGTIGRGGSMNGMGFRDFSHNSQLGRKRESVRDQNRKVIMERAPPRTKRGVYQ